MAESKSQQSTDCAPGRNGWKRFTPTCRPKVEGLYLVWLDWGAVAFARWHHYDGGVFRRFGSGVVTHWQELIGPPGPLS